MKSTQRNIADNYFKFNEMFLSFVLDIDFVDEIYIYDLPPLNFVRYLSTASGENVAIHVGWLINGYLGTNENRAFFSDIISRFIKTFKVYHPELEHVYNCYLDQDDVIYSDVPCGLKDFSRKLDSIKNIKLPAQRADSYDDYKFWAIKLHAEDLIRQNKFIVYEQLQNFAFLNFPDAEASTLRAKCRSIWKWYEKRDFRIKENKYKSREAFYKETKMTRTEHIKKINEKRTLENQKKIQKITSGLFAADYKKSSGAWHIAKIADVLGLNRKTVAKYLKSAEVQQCKSS